MHEYKLRARRIVEKIDMIKRVLRYPFICQLLWINASPLYAYGRKKRRKLNMSLSL